MNVSGVMLIRCSVLLIGCLARLLEDICGKIPSHRQIRAGSTVPYALIPIGLRLECGVHSLSRMLDRIAPNIERYMDLLGARQKLVASNLANADTPGYKTKDLDFQSELRGMIEGAPPHAVEVSGLKIRNDGNNVDVDREARLLSENALRFSVASQLIRGQIKSLRSAIQEGKS